MKVLRTPDSQFEGLVDWPFEPRYTMIEADDGTPLRIHHVEMGPPDGEPILLMHGVHDVRVKASQSVRMAEALRAHGKQVELVLFDKAGHGLHRWQDRLIAFRKTEEFLASCLGGRSRGYDFFELGTKLF